MDNYKTISIAIIRVKQLSFFIREHLINSEGKEVKFSFQQKNRTDKANNILHFTLRTFFYYEESMENVLVDSEVQNTFLVKDLNNYVTDNGNILFPEEVWLTFTGMAISHSRALLAQSLAGTVYDTVILPVINPKEIVDILFPIIEPQ